MTVWLPPPLRFDVTAADPGPWTVRATLLESTLLKTFWGSPALATLILWPLTTCSSSVKLKGHKNKWIHIDKINDSVAGGMKEGREGETSKLRRKELRSGARWMRCGESECMSKWVSECVSEWMCECVSEWYVTVYFYFTWLSKGKFISLITI